MKVFLSAPYKNYMKGNVLDENLYKLLKTIITIFEESGIECYNSHMREKWGKRYLSPLTATLIDYLQIETSDFLLAIITPIFSGGVYIEIGWASSLKKPLIIFIHEKANVTDLLYGIVNITPSVLFKFSEFKDILSQIKYDVIPKIKSNWKNLFIWPPKEFYNSIANKYEKLMEEDKISGDYSKKLELILRFIKKGSSILDIGCGTGILGILLEKYGYEYFGIDISERMIEKCKKYGLNCEKLSLEEFTYSTYFKKKFDAVISLNCGFSYTNDPIFIEDALTRIKEVLKPGGIVIWDSPNKILYNDNTLSFKGVDDLKTLVFSHNSNYLKSIFEKVGLRVIEILGNYDKNIYSSNSPRIIIVAKK